MKKILTISVAAYNAARDLPKCLDSITACLNIDKIEIFIVDDGSTDATRDVALKYCIQFPQSVFLISKKNGGHGSTINASIQKSSATFFKIVDADDWIYTANLDKLIGYLEGTSADMILNPYYEVSANQQLNKKIVFPCNQTLIENRKEISIADCSNEIYLYMHSITFRTACLKKCGPIIDEHCFYVDAEYTVFPIPYVNTVACLEYPIYNYLLGTQTQSMNMKNLQKRRDQHLRVTKRLVDFYNNLSTNVSTAQKNVIRVRLIGVVILQYIILLTVDGNVGKQEIKEYDLWLNDTSPELYNLVPQYAEGGYIKVALFARKTKFIFYSVYRTILKKLHLIKE